MLKIENSPFMRRLAVVAALAVAAGVLEIALIRAEKRLAAAESLYADLAAGRARYQSMADEVKAFRKRADEGKNRNFITETEKMAADMGLSKSLRKIALAGKKKQGAYTAEQYELKFEGVNMNAAVNVLYRIAAGPLPLRIDRCAIASSFDNPSLLSLTLLVSHLP